MAHQADVDHHTHADWIEHVSDHVRVCFTINEHDQVLDASDTVNPDRLGNRARDLFAEGVTYRDFTHREKVGKSHRPWDKPGRKNEAVKEFYRWVFTGRRGEKAAGAAYRQ